MKHYFLLFLSSLLIISSCKKETEVTPVDTIVRKYLDRSYRNNESNKIDFFLPANRNLQTPFVILIHGGGWTAGDKQDDIMQAAQDSLLKRGIASASMNYRYVSNTVHYQQLMEDVGNAIKYCIRQSDSFNIRSTDFVLAGISAGAHLSLLYGYDFDAENNVAAIVSLSGPTNLTDEGSLQALTFFQLKDAVEDLAGQPITKPLHENYTLISPLFQTKNVPTLIVHGDADPLVNYQAHAIALQNTLNQEGIANKLYTVQGASHDLGVANPQNLTNIINEVEDWINTYGK